MLGNHKKKNPEPESAKQTDETAVAPPEPPKIPPLRTFVVRSFDGFNMNERIVTAHGLGIDDSRMVSFVVFFIDILGRPTQAQKLVLNAEAWDEVEEINAEFPVMEKH
jgi:hypothetical protein